MNSDDRFMGMGFAIPFMLFLVIISMFFIILMVDYFSTFTIKDTIDNEFKNIVVNEMAKKLTDEYSSDYVAKFDDVDKNNLESVIRNEFINRMKAEKNTIINVTSLDIKNPSTLTITCHFSGTYEFKPIISRGLITFQMPVESKAKVIRFDEY